MDSRRVKARRAGEQSWMWTDIAADVISVSSEVSGKLFVESGVPHVIAVKV